MTQEQKKTTRKSTSEDVARKRMAHICSMREYCAFDIEQKLRRMELEKDAAARIIAALRKHGYIDDKRFAKSFIHDKSQFNKWGKIKLEFALRQKRIPQSVIDTVFSEYGYERESSNLQQLLQNKVKSVKGVNDYERKNKLIRFAASRGYALDEILEQIGGIDMNVD